MADIPLVRTEGKLFGAALDLPPSKAEAWNDVLDNRSLTLEPAAESRLVSAAAERMIASWI